MSTENATGVIEADPFLVDLGRRVKALRRAAKLSRRQVAEISNVSQRFLSQFESGDGNISISRLRSICMALNFPLENLLRDENANPVVPNIIDGLQQASPAQLSMIQEVLEIDHSRVAPSSRIALIGLRGAGKSTLAPRLADALGYRLIELNQEIRKTTGLDLGEVFSLYGQSGYRRLEREALERVAVNEDHVVITTSGGVVSDATTYRYLLSEFLTVWLSASPEEHMRRVVDQGDRRPIEHSAAPMQALKAILYERKPLYSMAQLHLDTSGQGLENSVEALISAVTSVN